MSYLSYRDEHESCKEELRRAQEEWSRRHQISNQVKCVVLEYPDGKEKFLDVISVMRMPDGLVIKVREYI